MRITLITATCNRHRCLERTVGMFLEQIIPVDVHATHLIFNNSDNPLTLDTIGKYPNKTILLINSINKGYTNLGQIYTDALKYVPESTDVINHLDDDDIISVDHIAEGIKGYKEALLQGKEAYKPKKSFYLDGKGCHLVENTLEPSIFVKADTLREIGYKDTTSDQHLSWVNYLVYNNKIFVDPEGAPTLGYNWSGDIQVYKTSGDPNNPQNFSNYRKYSNDTGDGIITPYTKKQLKKLYK